MAASPSGLEGSESDEELGGLPLAPRERELSPGLVAALAGHIDGLDGIRAFAVIAVVAFHLWPRGIPGGFLGVDVFFVVSGFLITTLLLREGNRTGRVDTVAFWRRRARRLLPALIVVVVVTLIVASMVSRDLLVGIDRQTLGALTFSSNWLEIRAGADYFDSSSPVLFGPFWSLAVEEQFYLFWPLILIGVLALAHSAAARVRIVAGIGVVSALLMGVWFRPGSNPTRVYYGTDTHLFGLMFGAAVALAFAGGVGVVAQRRWWRLRRWVGFLALIGLVLLVFTIDSASSFTYRGGIVLAALLTAVVVASLPGPPSALTTFATWRPLAWIGQRAYGIYLWHWPVILIVTAGVPAVAPGAGPGLLAVVLSIGATLALAAASYRWIEMPIRRGGFGVVWTAFGRQRVAWASVGLVLVIAGLAITNAPEKSEAQMAVERGENAIAAEAGSSENPGQSEGADTSGESPLVTESLPAAPGPAWPVDLPEPPGALVSGYGDSVLSGAAPAVYRRFPGVFLDAKPIRQWKNAPELLRQSVADGTMRPVVILNFGTNWGLQSTGAEEALRASLDELGPFRRVVLVNTVGVSDWVPSTNAKLAAISAEYPNTIVADWHTIVAEDPSLLHSDRTHPNMKGIDVYADMVARAMQELGPQ